MFPDVKSERDLEEMRRKKRLSGHPLRMVSVLSEAVSSINDAKVFYRKMDNVGRLMAKAGVDDENLQVCCFLFQLGNFVNVHGLFHFISFHFTFLGRVVIQ